MPKTTALTPERYVLLGPTPRLRRPLPPNVTVCRPSEVGECVREAPRRSVFVSFRSASTDALLKAGLEAGRRSRIEDLVTLEPPRAGSVPSLLGLFRTVVGAAAEYRWLPPEPFVTVIAGDDAGRRFIGAAADAGSESVALLRGNLQTVVVPFAFFEPSGDGVTPDFGRLSVNDYGHTVAFGDYEASADAVLYETDAEYRRALNKERTRSERSFGASLRRLRLQRRLKRSDFPGAASKTIARIERNEVGRPHGTTLEAIARRLGVRADQIETY